MTVTPGEFGMLSRRVEQMDQQGTRGVAGLAIQLTETNKDISDLKAEFHQHKKDHEEERVRNEEAATSSRRWRWTAAIAGIAGVATVVGLLLDIASKIHH